MIALEDFVSVAREVLARHRKMDAGSLELGPEAVRTCTLSDLGIDSLIAMEIVAELEDRFLIPANFAEYSSSMTVAEFLEGFTLLDGAHV